MRFLFLFLISVVALSSCTMSPPHINFAVSGESNAPFYGMHGVLYSAFGSRVNRDGSTVAGTDQRLFTVIFLTPGLTGSKSAGGSSGSSPRFQDVLISQGVPPNQVQSKFRWDKANNIVAIDEQMFDRDKGNVFIVEKSLKGSARVWQLQPPKPMKDSSDVLAFAKAQLPDLESLKVATFDVNEYLQGRNERNEKK
ncbi:MAG: hypothetical protein ACKVQS_14705 [Fimbriimonadaceae bacterium]